MFVKLRGQKKFFHIAITGGYGRVIKLSEPFGTICSGYVALLLVMWCSCRFSLYPLKKRIAYAWELNDEGVL